MTNTSNVSRRKLLASMPAAAAAMAPIGAAALCRLPGDGDPIIEVVARHRQAWETYEAAWEHTSKTEDEFGSEETASILLYEYDETEADPVNVNDGELHIRWKKTGKKKPVFATDYAGIRGTYLSICAVPNGPPSEKPGSPPRRRNWTTRKKRRSSGPGNHRPASRCEWQERPAMH